MGTVRRWMSTLAVVALTTTLLPEARHLLREQRIRRIPVVDKQGQFAGIVSEEDINRISDSEQTDVRDHNLISPHCRPTHRRCDDKAGYNGCRRHRHYGGGPTDD
ncbi:MAG: CBS domain-containing protein [Chloroflexales bacterium]|nr:CBS domain-containing protein [Chloroflexales bacterium]